MSSQIKIECNRIRGRKEKEFHHHGTRWHPMNKGDITGDKNAILHAIQFSHLLKNNTRICIGHSMTIILIYNTLTRNATLDITNEIMTDKKH